MNKIQYVEGDLFAAVSADKSPDPIFIPHVVNSLGGWGSGFVVPLGRKFPLSKSRYLSWHSGDKKEELFSGEFALGKTQFVEIDKKIFVANMVAQTLGGLRPLFYNCLSKCMDGVAEYITRFNELNLNTKARIICPMFSAGLAGGNWNFTEMLVEDCWIKRGIPVTVHYLPNALPDNYNPAQKKS